MAHISAFERAALGVSTLALAFGLAGPASAQSLKPGECVSKARFEQIMVQDNQKPKIVTTRDTTGAPAAIITSNPDGSLGYTLLGDQTLGVPSTKICAKNVIKDIKFIEPNPKATGLPQGVSIKSHNGLDPAKIYASGGRLVMIAQTFEKDARGNDILGAGYAVFANPDPNNRGGGAWNIDSLNRPSLSFTFSNFAFTQHANLIAPSPSR